MRKVYVVVGLVDDSENGNIPYIALSDDHGAYNKFEDAREELYKILAEIREESEKEGYTFETEFYEKELRITFETGLVEIYKIHELKIN